PKARAGFQLVAPRRAILRRTALDAVGYEQPFTRQALIRKQLVEIMACRTDERAAARILFATRTFAQQHDLRARRAFAGHRVSAAFMKPAGDASANAAGQVFEPFGRGP